MSFTFSLSDFRKADHRRADGHNINSHAVDFSAVMKLRGLMKSLHYNIQQILNTARNVKARSAMMSPFELFLRVLVGFAPTETVWSVVVLL